MLAHQHSSSEKDHIYFHGEGGGGTAWGEIERDALSHTSPRRPA